MGLVNTNLLWMIAGTLAALSIGTAIRLAALPSFCGRSRQATTGKSQSLVDTGVTLVNRSDAWANRRGCPVGDRQFPGLT